jgi:hypothetical protein
MNWELISAVAGVLGVIGGLVSVVFLILEVRRNALAIEGATVQSLMSFENAVYALIAANAKVYTTGLKDRAALSEEDQLVFDMVVQSYMSLSYSAFAQFQQGLIDPDVWKAYSNAMRRRMKGPGFAASWSLFCTGYPEPFQAFVATV